MIRGRDRGEIEVKIEAKIEANVKAKIKATVEAKIEAMRACSGGADSEGWGFTSWALQRVCHHLSRGPYAEYTTHLL